MAWKAMKSSGEPVLPVAWFLPRRQCSRKSRRNFVASGDLVPATCGPPTLAVGKARFTASAA